MFWGWTFSTGCIAASIAYTDAVRAIGLAGTSVDSIYLPIGLAVTGGIALIVLVLKVADERRKSDRRIERIERMQRLELRVLHHMMLKDGTSDNVTLAMIEEELGRHGKHHERRRDDHERNDG